ncbi:iron-containing alcohol dehydrogenase [Spirosoma sp. HMF4905]|uniref:Iron-containing alcohol dehydrogenase n=1 Tax=Spirosoma arboris TaxID=2682092 RepID=A0A7K1SC43_9BACT|nr:iron-containing alcohol dehydrogenase [Spirosoma arboris]MVM31377.1 iron-containing alcohol dehydrogenase [Spirosoma arboris]
MSYLFNAPQTIIHGAGASRELLPQLTRIGARRVFFVTDPFIESTGLVQALAAPLHQAGLAVAVFSAVQPDPTVQTVLDGLAELTKHDADVVVAVGGGSSIDAAKAIAVLRTNEGPLHKYMGYHKIPNAGLPVIAIPTTAGTGSEATKVTVITDTELNVKMMILDAHLMPAIALVDYELTLSMPPALTAHVGVDTLTHGMEAYVSQKANVLSDPLALSCIELVSKHLQTAWQEPTHREAREGMSLAACLGGLAFTNSSVCLVHGMSRPLGVQFHLPHGLSNAVLLPTVTQFSVSGALERYAMIARAMDIAQVDESDEAASAALVAGLERQNRSLKIPRLRDCVGVDQSTFEQVLEKMAADALASGSPQNNPTVPTANQIVALYRQAW